MGSPALRAVLALAALFAPAVRALAEDPAPGSQDLVVPRSPVVVLARVAWVKPGVGGAQHVARLEVERALRGSAEAAPTVFLAGPSSRADLRLRGRLENEVGRRSVFFLSRTGRGSGWVIDALFSAEGTAGSEKAAVLEREIAIEDVADPAERRRESVSLYLDVLARGGAWGRSHASRHLLALAADGSEAFPDTAPGEVSAALARAVDPRARAALEGVLLRIADGQGTGPRPRQAPDAETRRRHWREAEGDDARLVALTAYARAAGPSAREELSAAAEDSSPRVRERAAVLLGDLRAKEALPRLLERYPIEADAAVREAVVRAVGLAGDEASVPWVIERSREEPTRRAALYALARIGGEAAGERLAAMREEALSSSPPDRATAALADYVRGPAFRDAERAAGRDVRPLAGRPSTSSGRPELVEGRSTPSAVPEPSEAR
jgi:hypothetical protein